MTDAELLSHYLSFGLLEGRRANVVSDRQAFALLAVENSPEEKVLEISPYANPAVPIEHSLTCDLLPYEALVQRAVESDVDPKQIRKPDWVIEPSVGLVSLDRSFKSVLSSHVIEHMPNLLLHLIQVRDILHPGGRYFVLVPDKRFCFDHFLPLSSVADILGAYLEKRERHLASHFIEHRALTTHNYSSRHWAGDHEDKKGEQELIAQLKSAREEYKRSRENYLDVHAWKFTPASFESILRQCLKSLDISNLEIERVYPTLFNSNEFWVIFRKVS